jgi:ribonucleoside-diphosphate reductase alpha chain
MGHTISSALASAAMSQHPHPFDIAPISKRIWAQKYQFKSIDGSPIDATIDDTWMRLARAAAAAEPGGDRAQAVWTEKFAAGLADFGFLPAGRIIAGAGTGRAVSLFNCFVMGRIEDDLSSIFDQVREAALTMQAGGGIGHDFSTLRPMGAIVRSIGADASGPVSFMDVWDAMCRTIMSAGARRGAMMATMRCDHPDIETFIAAKADAKRLRNFNLSVLVTDPFVTAVRTKSPWDLVFEGRVYATVDAAALWDQMMRATYDYAEPGVIFIDRINATNNLAYCEDIRATNPCGEQPLPPYGACLLGSINLSRFVERPFATGAGLDIAGIEERVRLAVRFLDNIIDISRYPLEAQAKEARAKRRIGLGVTGLADALIMCGLHYGEAAGVDAASKWMSVVQNAAYAASAELAAEKGAFPLYDAAQFNARSNVLALDPSTRAQVAKSGVRNGCLTSIAPTGTISLLAGNISSGIEPVFDFAYSRRVLEADGRTREEHVEDYAYALRKRLAPASEGPFVTAAGLSPAQHLAMQAGVQRFVDSSISKTINCPADMAFPAFKDIYLDAYDAGLKGCTTFRPNAVTGSVLSASSLGTAAVAPPAAVTSVSPMAGEPQSAVVYMSKPLERDPVLAGFTYKLSWPGQDNALYITINDIDRGGRLCPFEIFINTKNLEHYAWTVALTRMISAIFRRGGDLAFVVEELKAIFDPQGGRWMDGRYVPSLLAAIGEVIEMHMVRIGFLKRGDPLAKKGASDRAELDAASSVPGAGKSGLRGSFGSSEPASDVMIEPVEQKEAMRVGEARALSGHSRHGSGATTGSRMDAVPVSTRLFAGGADTSLSEASVGIIPQQGRFCPRCANPSLIRLEGCWSCQTCGYSRCD